VFDVLHEFLHGHKWLALVIDLVGLALIARVLLRAKTQPGMATTRRGDIPATPRPTTIGSKPTQQLLIDTEKAERKDPASLQAGLAGRLNRGLAPTARIPTPPEKPPEKPALRGTDLPTADARPAQTPLVRRDGEAIKPPGLENVPLPAAKRSITETDAVRKADRLEQLGFHHSIASTPPPADAPVAPEARSQRLAELGVSGNVKAAPAATELDDILARLDEVLGEDPVQPIVTPAVTRTPAADSVPTAKTAEPAKAGPEAAPTVDGKPRAPLWARADAFDEDLDKKDKPTDGTQLGIFEGGDKPKPG